MNNADKLNQVKSNITGIMQVDNNRGNLLLKLLNLTLVNPSVIGKIALTTPLKILDIINTMEGSSDFKNLVIDASNKNIELEMIKKLQDKISDLEQKITNSSTSSSTGVSSALLEMIGKNKFIDSKGMVQDLMYGDFQYNQLTPDQMQALGSSDKTISNKWDNSYTLLNTDKWRPPIARERVCKQEKECPVCPSLTSGYPLNLMDYDKSRYVLGPDNIQIDYIKNLNNSIKP